MKVDENVEFFDFMIQGKTEKYKRVQHRFRAVWYRGCTVIINPTVVNELERLRLERCKSL